MEMRRKRCGFGCRVSEQDPEMPDCRQNTYRLSCRHSYWSDRVRGRRFIAAPSHFWVTCSSNHRRWVGRALQLLHEDRFELDAPPKRNGAA